MINKEVAYTVQLNSLMLVNMLSHAVWPLLLQKRYLPLTCFSEVLENLFEIVDVSALSDDYIAEKLLLLSDIKIAFNDENIVTNIEQL